MLLSAEHLSKNYGMKTLLEDASIYLEQGEKIGVIGINGTGKSTLLRLLSGTEAPDEGAVRRDPNVQVSYLRQNPEMNPNASILEQVFLGFPGDFRELKEFEAKTMLTKLGLTDYDQKIGTLSGGQRKRVALCTALIHPADVLLLDEPTNHLDAYMVEWLEQWLRNFRGGIIMVTHDRYFLERVCNRICQVERGKLYFYEANYSKYLELRQQRYDYAQAAERKRQTLLRREYQWIIRGPQARGTKAKDRIRRYAELKAQDTPETQGTVQTAAMSSRLGKKTIELVNVEKSYDGREILKPFSYLLGREDRIGVVGRNGAGKSTLLELIAGKIQPTAGEITWGETVKIGYFSQEGRELDLNQRPYDYIHEIAATVKTAEGTFSASQMLERFLFDGDLQYSTIGALSGGERRRLYLLGVLMSAPNVLLLDEPTNDLDIETLTILEDYLASFDGIVIAVSHDRYFLDKIATQIFEVSDSGEVLRYTGGYTDYLEKRRESAPEVKEKKEKKETPREPKPPKLRFSYKEQREYAVIEDEIAQLEEKIAQADADMAANATDYTALQRLTEEKEQLETALEEKMGRWMYLSELAEKIEAQKES
ncbi:MAG: ABC-F family ATP-binding cassette domain-containing protein [Oscillospiraceae bacterium]|nr:ABC-F family ATP-binding cassette domain-containing protein [Oscillospiraceae bacterium]